MNERAQVGTATEERFRQRGPSGLRGLVAGACLLAILGFGTLALAAKPLVAVVTEEPDSTRVTRLRAELQSLGVEVRVLEIDADESVERSSLERLAREVGAFAALRTVPLAKGVEVWIADRATGKTSIREFVAPDATGGAGTSDEQIAVGVVELLRASLMELHASEAAPPSEVEPSPEIEALAHPTDPHTDQVTAIPASWVVGLGPGMDVGAGAFGASLHGQLELCWMHRLARSELELGPCAWATMQGLGPSRTEASGEAELDIAAAGVGPLLQPVMGRFRPSLGVGLSLVAVTTRGQPAPGYVGVEEHQMLVAPFAEMGLSYRLGERLSLRGFSRALWPTRRVRIEVVGEEVATWGRPGWLAGVGVELWLP